MKLFFLVLILLCMSAGNLLFAQSEYQNYLGGSFGGSDFHIKDEHASPLIFGSLGIAPSLQYFHKGEESRHYFEAAYYYDYLTTTASNFETANHRARIRYSYLHSITDFKFFEKELKLFLGGSIGSFLCHSDYYYRLSPTSVARSNESWYWSNSLDLSAQLEYNPAAREFFSVQLFMPIISNVSRPKYSQSGNYNYVDNDWRFKMFGDEYELFYNNFSLNALLTYQRPLVWNLNLQINYEFFYSFYDKPNDVNMYMNNFRAGLFFCF